MKAYFIIFFILIIGPLQAQKKTRVIVIDSLSFKPLPAVFVHVKHTNRSLLVDTTGIFTINTKRMDTLMLSHVGYKNVEIPLFFEEDAILIRMPEKVTILNEVTVASRKLYPSEINPRKSRAPRTVGLVESLASPWEYFNKREKEKRKLAQLMEENDRIITFMEVVTDPFIKEELMNDYGVSEATYYELLVKYNQKKLPVIYSNDADAIITSLHEFFESNK